MDTTMTAATNTGTCQICERTCKIVRGKISLHGYTRPGCGFVNGQCWGAKRAAYPATDALVDYAEALGSRLAHVTKLLADVQSPDLCEVTCYEHVGGAWSTKTEAKVYVRGQRYATRYMPSVDMFAVVVSGRIDQYEGEIGQLGREIERVAKRIAAA